MRRVHSRVPPSVADVCARLNYKKLAGREWLGGVDVFLHQKNTLAVIVSKRYGNLYLVFPHKNNITGGECFVLHEISRKNGSPTGNEGRVYFLEAPTGEKKFVIKMFNPRGRPLASGDRYPKAWDIARKALADAPYFLNREIVYALHSGKSVSYSGEAPRSWVEAATVAPGMPGEDIADMEPGSIGLRDAFHFCMRFVRFLVDMYKKRGVSVGDIKPHNVRYIKTKTIEPMLYDADAAISGNIPREDYALTANTTIAFLQNHLPAPFELSDSLAREMQSQMTEIFVRQREPACVEFQLRRMLEQHLQGRAVDENQTKEVITYEQGCETQNLARQCLNTVTTMSRSALPMCLLFPQEQENAGCSRSYAPVNPFYQEKNVGAFDFSFGLGGFLDFACYALFVVALLYLAKKTIDTHQKNRSEWERRHKDTEVGNQAGLFGKGSRRRSSPQANRRCQFVLRSHNGDLT